MFLCNTDIGYGNTSIAEHARGCSCNDFNT